MDDFKHLSGQKHQFRHTPTQLKNLIEAVKRFDQYAIDRLCKDFEPLINKEARRDSVYKALGEDAVNTAWEIFLSFIYKYDGNNYRLLPGLIQKHLHYRLLDLLHQQGCLLDCDAIDASEGYADTLADKHDIIAESNDRLSVDGAVDKLTAQQKLVINEVFLRDLSLQECSKKHGLTKQSCHVYKTRALKQLKKYLSP